MVILLSATEDSILRVRHEIGECAPDNVVYQDELDEQIDILQDLNSQLLSVFVATLLGRSALSEIEQELVTTNEGSI